MKQKVKSHAGTPIERAREICARNNIVFEEAFQEFISAPLHVVVSTPENFGMARAVKFNDGREAWLVGLVVGNACELVKQLPFKLPFIAFYRSKHRRQRIFPTEKFIRRMRLQ